MERSLAPVSALLSLALLSSTPTLGQCQASAGDAPAMGDPIAYAESAGIPEIATEATILDANGNVLREGTNEWTCLAMPQAPMCLDAQWMALVGALMSGNEEFEATSVGVAYMLRGDAGVSTTDPSARAQDPSPLARVEALGLDTVKVGRVIAHFASADREHAHRFAALSEGAAAYFERELGASFPLHLAVLSPEDWFDPYPGGGSLPYGMPWGWVEDLLITAPASLDQGVLILGGSDGVANQRRVQFVLLHEFGHLANKQHLHPESSHLYSSVRWFEEFLATYFAYAYVRSHHSGWAEASRREWVDFVEGYTPSVLSLDWGFMRELPPEDFVRTYAWYQNLLNLRVADLYEEHGLDFLRALRDRLPWEESGAWTTEYLLPALEEIAPGFKAWADDIQSGDYLPDHSSI